MQASSLAKRIKRCMVVGEWAWWQAPPMVRSYVAVIIVLDLGAILVAALHTDWHLADGVKFLLLMSCGVVSIASTPRIMYTYSGVTRDFSSIWVLPTAILLPPIYAALIPIPIVATLQIFVHRGLTYRRVFTAATTSIGYAAASMTFHFFPHSFAGGNTGTGLHAFTWVLAAAVCEVVGSKVHGFLILFAVKLSAPRQVRIREIEWSRETLQGLFVEIDLGVLITLAIGLSPALVLIAVPSVLLVRRFMVFPILVAQSRIDPKTSLLNMSTWESEAETELSRSARLRHPLAIALVDIDHFKVVNDTYGHLVGDRVLKAIAEALTTQSRDYDRAGRFGGEEFVLLLAQTTEKDACRIAERLRGYVASLAIPTGDRPDAPTLQVTISIGVTSMARGESFELTDLLAAADSAMYHAKQAGRNQVAYAHPLSDMGIDAAWTPETGTSADNAGDARSSATRRAGTPLASAPLTSHRVRLVQAEPSGASLCPRR